MPPVSAFVSAVPPAPFVEPVPPTAFDTPVERSQFTADITPINPIEDSATVVFSGEQSVGPSPASESSAEPTPADSDELFGKPKSFKVVQTVKSFKVVGGDFRGLGSPAEESPSPEAPQSVETPISVEVSQSVEIPTEAPPYADASPSPETVISEPTPIVNDFTTSTGAEGEPTGQAMGMPSIFSELAAAPGPQTSLGTQIASPPTMAFSTQAPEAPAADSLPVPDPFSFGDPAQSGPTEPPITMNMGAPATEESTGIVSGDFFPSPLASTDELLARFSKPEPALITGVPKREMSSNKPLMIIVGVVLCLIVSVGVIFLRQPKEELKHMTALDDGKAPIGAANLDEGNLVAPPVAPKPELASTQEPSTKGPASDQAAAIKMVKEYPLEGNRVSVGNWLQYSYTASPNAGTESWNASLTADNTVLVEYRFVSRAAGGTPVVYLFEADMKRGLVSGKNLEARQMLVGGAKPAVVKAASKPAAKPVRRAQKAPVVARAPNKAPAPRKASRPSRDPLPLPGSSDLFEPSTEETAFDSEMNGYSSSRAAARNGGSKVKSTADAFGGDPDMLMPGESASSSDDEDAFGLPASRPAVAPTARRTSARSARAPAVKRTLGVEITKPTKKKRSSQKSSSQRRQEEIRLPELPETSDLPSSSADEDAFGAGQ